MTMANYFTASILMWALFVSGAAWIYMNRSSLTRNAKLATLGLVMVCFHWAVHQAYWGFWWFDNKFGYGEYAPLLQANSHYLSGTYWVMYMGAVVTTTAAFSGRFAKTVAIKTIMVAGVWGLVVALSTIEIY